MTKPRTINIHTAHMVATGSLLPDDDGWFHSRCDCGYGPAGPWPAEEELVDDLMQHAREMGYLQAHDEKRAP